MTSCKKPKKVAIYVDGYNLYYGRLRGTKFKWLDLVKFSENLIKKRDQGEQIEFVHLFTSPALAKFATHGKESVEAQSSYIRALENLYPEKFKVTYGKHLVKEGVPLPIFKEGEKFDKNEKTKVWLIEEKKTDVSLAITMYSDMYKSLSDRVILISNDSDAEPVLKAIKEDFPSAEIGVIQPIHESTTFRRSSGSLKKHANWIIESISDDELRDAQLPEKIKTKKKPIFKPKHWK